MFTLSRRKLHLQAFEIYSYRTLSLSTFRTLSIDTQSVRSFTLRMCHITPSQLIPNLPAIDPPGARQTSAYFRFGMVSSRHEVKTWRARRVSTPPKRWGHQGRFKAPLNGRTLLTLATSIYLTCRARIALYPANAEVEDHLGPSDCLYFDSLAGKSMLYDFYLLARPISYIRSFPFPISIFSISYPWLQT